MRRAEDLQQAAVIDVDSEVVGGGLRVYPEGGRYQLGVGAGGELGQAGAGPLVAPGLRAFDRSGNSR
jgi:hypothetical protein